MSKTYIASLLAIAVLTGCSKIMPKLDEVIPDNRVEYKKSKTLPDLEVPPDLTTDAIKDRMAVPEGGTTATYSTYQERVAKQKRKSELEKSQNEAIQVLENEHVLAVEGAAKQIWPKLHEFMTSKGYTLELDDEDLGVIETAWVENQENLQRDKFKIFAEAGTKAGTTVLYVSHRGEELSPTRDWQSRPRDVEKEAALVASLQEYLTGRPAGEVVSADAPAVAARQDSADDTGTPRRKHVASGEAELISAGGGKIYLAVPQELSAAWTTVGKALEKAGIEVEEADKDKNSYYIRVALKPGEEKKRGMLSKLKFWGDDNDEAKLQLSLSNAGTNTEVVVLDKDGRWETGTVAERVLKRVLTAMGSPGS